MQVVDLTGDIRKTCEGMGKGSQKKKEPGKGLLMSR